MKHPTFLTVLVFAGRAALAADVSLAIEPDPYVSSDHATICRVFVRNASAHTLDGRSVAFEAQALENGAVVMREHGRFAGAIGPNETAETRIGFNGVFTTFAIAESPEKSRGEHTGSRKGAKSRAGTKTSRASKTRASKPARKQSAR